MKSWKVLGYLGLIPFIACLYVSSETVFFGISAKQTFVAYSAIILSFIAGTIWRRDVDIYHDKRHIISNVFSLIAFVSLLVERELALIILALSFMFLFVYENTLTKQKNHPTDYMNMRFWLTQLVVLFHVTAYALWFG
jgi:hypothetical protein